MIAHSTACATEDAKVTEAFNNSGHSEVKVSFNWVITRIAARGMLIWWLTFRFKFSKVVSEFFLFFFLQWTLNSKIESEMGVR